MDSPTDLKAKFQIEREDLNNRIAAKDSEIKELKSTIDMLKTQVGIATQGGGIPEHLLQDVRARMAMGLPMAEAITCAHRQWENDIKNKVKEAPAPAAPVPQPTPTPAQVSHAPAQAAPVETATKGKAAAK